MIDGSLNTSQTEFARTSAGYYEEPSFSSFTFPSSINPNDSSNWINLGDNAFLIDGPVKFTDIANFLKEASGQQVVNYSLDNLFVTADNANITLSPEANFLKPHKVSEFLGANFGMSIVSGPYGSYHALPQVLVSEGGYGNDAVNLSNPAGDGVVRVLASNIMPNNGTPVTENSRFISFAIDTTAPAGKWIKYRIKCWNVLYETFSPAAQNYDLQNLWPIANHITNKLFEPISPLISWSKTYASIAGRNTNNSVRLVAGNPNFYGLAYTRMFSGKYLLNLETILCLDPYETDGYFLASDTNYTFAIPLSQYTKWFVDFDTTQVDNQKILNELIIVRADINYFSNALSLGSYQKGSLSRIFHDLITKAEFNGYFNDQSYHLKVTQAAKPINSFPVMLNGQIGSGPNSLLTPVLTESRCNYSLEINSTDQRADIDNLHTVLEYGYYDYSSNNAQSHASIQGRDGYYFQEGLAYIQPGSNGVNKATASIYFKDDCFPEGNLQIFADNITDFALTKVDDSPGNYGIVSGQALLNLQDIQNFVQTNETLTDPQVAEKNTAKVLWEKLYYENESYYVNEQNLQHIQDFENNIHSPSNENWCHLRTANYVDVNGQIKQDFISQYQDDVFREYYELIHGAPTRASYYDSQFLTRKTMPDILAQKDRKDLIFNVFDKFILTYEYDIPVKYKNFVDQALNYVNCLIDGVFSMHITIKKMPQDQQSQGVLIDSYIDTENNDLQIIQAHEFYGQDTFNIVTRAVIFINPDLLDTAGIENVGYYQSSTDPDYRKDDLLNKFSMLITREVFSVLGLRGDVPGYGWNNQYNINVVNVNDSYKAYGIFNTEDPTWGVQNYRFENSWKRINDDNTSVIIDHGSNEFTFQHNYGKKLSRYQIFLGGLLFNPTFDILSSDNNSIKLKFNTTPTNQDVIQITNSFAVMYHWLVLHIEEEFIRAYYSNGIAVSSDAKYLSEVPHILSNFAISAYKYEISSEEMDVTTNQFVDISYITMGLLLDLGFSLRTVTTDVLESADINDILFLNNTSFQCSNALIDKFEFDDQPDYPRIPTPITS